MFHKTQGTPYTDIIVAAAGLSQSGKDVFVTKIM